MKLFENKLRPSSWLFNSINEQLMLLIRNSNFVSSVDIMPNLLRIDAATTISLSAVQQVVRQ